MWARLPNVNHNIMMQHGMLCLPWEVGTGSALVILRPYGGWTCVCYSLVSFCLGLGKWDIWWRFGVCFSWGSWCWLLEFWGWSVYLWSVHVWLLLHRLLWLWEGWFSIHCFLWCWLVGRILCACVRGLV